MKCPRCQVKLARQMYEELPIHGCQRCRGHLLTKQRLGAIKNRRKKTLNDLRDEIFDVQDHTDLQDRVRCPKCRSWMEGRKRPFGPTHFTIDRCNRCSLIWLDGGELAKLQVAFEFSELGMERQRIRSRLENMTPAEKEEFDKRISKLPDYDFVSELISSYVTEGLGSRWDAYYGVDELFDSNFLGFGD